MATAGSSITIQTARIDGGAMKRAVNRNSGGAKPSSAGAGARRAASYRSARSTSTSIKAATSWSKVGSAYLYAAHTALAAEMERAP